MKYIKLFEYVEEPLRNHRLRMDKSYRPRYRSGVIGIRFIGDSFNKKITGDGEVVVDYHDLFSDPLQNKELVKFFENKYDIKMVKNQSDLDEFYIHFKCNPGDEEDILNRLSKDKIVEDVDFVDTRETFDGEMIMGVVEELSGIGEYISEYSDEHINNVLIDSIKKLKKLIKK